MTQLRMTASMFPLVSTNSTRRKPGHPHPRRDCEEFPGNKARNRNFTRLETVKSGLISPVARGTAGPLRQSTAPVRSGGTPAAGESASTIKDSDITDMVSARSGFLLRLPFAVAATFPHFILSHDFRRLTPGAIEKSFERGLP